MNVSSIQSVIILVMCFQGFLFGISVCLSPERVLDFEGVV